LPRGLVLVNTLPASSNVVVEISPAALVVLIRRFWSSYP
jgi:hypothetical protein